MEKQQAEAFQEQIVGALPASTCWIWWWSNGDWSGHPNRGTQLTTIKQIVKYQIVKNVWLL